MSAIAASDIAKMSIQQRIQLVEDIWDSIAGMPESVEIPQWHQEELDKRLAAYHANPSERARGSGLEMMEIKRPRGLLFCLGATVRNDADRLR